MREGKQHDTKRGERPNMRGRHVNTPERQRRMPASQLKFRQVRGEVSTKPTEEKVYRYYALWKPYGVAAKYEDTKNARSLENYVPVEGVSPIGYLDATSEGILLLTDNPRFRFGINHTKCQETRIFLAQVEIAPDEEMISDEALDAMAEGVVLSDGKTLPLEVEVIEDPELPERPVPVKENKNTCWLAITCSEGWSRHIHRITAALGYPTLRLVQWAIGPVSLYEMTEGQLRELRHQEMRWVNSVLDRTPVQRIPSDRQRFKGNNRSRNARPHDNKRFACKDCDNDWKNEGEEKGGERRSRGGRFEKPARSQRNDSQKNERNSSSRNSRDQRNSKGNSANHRSQGTSHSHSPKGHSGPRGPQRENRGGGKGKGLRKR